MTKKKLSKQLRVDSPGIMNSKASKDETPSSRNQQPSKQASQPSRNDSNSNRVSPVFRRHRSCDCIATVLVVEDNFYNVVSVRMMLK